MSSLKEKALSGVGWNAVSTIGTTLISLLVMYVLARYLGPKEFGIVGMVMVSAGLLQVFQDLGFSAVIIQRPNITHNQLSSLYWLNIVAGLVICLALFFCRIIASDFFRQPQIKMMLPVIGVNVVIASVGMQYYWLSEKMLQFKRLSKIELMSVLCGNLSTIAMAIKGAGAWSVIVGLNVQTVIRTVSLIVLGKSEWKPKVHFSHKDLSGLVSFGAYQTAEKVINYFNAKIDQFVLGRFLGVMDLGYYNFATNIASQISNRINPILVRVAFPVFSAVQDDVARRRSIYMKFVYVVSIVNAPLHIGGAIVLPLFLHLVFRGKWDSTAFVLQVLLLVNYFRSLGNPVSSLTLSDGRADLTFWWNVGVFCVTPLSVVLGALAGGTKGVALALLMTQVIYFYPAYRVMIRPVIGGCFGEYCDSCFRPMLISIFMGICVRVLLFALPQSLWGVLACVILGGVIYALGLFVADRTRVGMVLDVFSRHHS